jgi:hypothetical protein
MRSPERRLSTVLMIAAAAVALMQPSARADDCRGSGEIRDRGGSARASCPGSAGQNAVAQPVRSGSPRGVECTSARAEDPAAWWVSYDVPDSVIPGEGGRGTFNALSPPEGQTIAVYRDCHGSVRGGVMWVPEPEPGTADDGDGIFLARQQARARVEPPAPVANVSPVEAVVRFATWLWLEPSYWQQTTAVESTPGGVSVAVTARPLRVVWDLGEGQRVCEGPGIPWTQAAHDAYEVQPESVRGAGNPACTFTFVNSSTTQPGGVFEASVTVAWEFSWALNGAEQGVFGTVEVGDAWQLRVGEIQAVITG